MARRPRPKGVWFKEGYWDRHARRSFLPPSDNPQTVRHRHYKEGWDEREREEQRHRALTSIPPDQWDD